MTRQDRPAGANVHYLEQGVSLIRRLGDETYVSCPETAYRGGVGAQFRHSLDFYDCFVRGLEAGQIDYGRRARDTRVETDRPHAIARIQAVCEQLTGLSADGLEKPVRVKAEDTARGAPKWSTSTPARELQFLLSHTIHHYAVIAEMLEARSCEIARELPEFGVAPSTLSCWKEAAL